MYKRQFYYHATTSKNTLLHQSLANVYIWPWLLYLIVFAAYSILWWSCDNNLLNSLHACSTWCVSATHLSYALLLSYNMTSLVITLNYFNCCVMFNTVCYSFHRHLLESYNLNWKNIQQNIHYKTMYVHTNNPWNMYRLCVCVCARARMCDTKLQWEPLRCV